jgi:hypothetical protein
LPRKPRGPGERRADARAPAAARRREVDANHALASYTLHSLREDTKFGAAGLVMAIVGGAIVPPIQGLASDRLGTAPAFVVAAICYLGVLIYAIFDLRAKDRFADILEQEPKIAMTGH